METMVVERWSGNENRAQADVRFEPSDNPAILDMLDDTPTGAGAIIVLGSPTWVDYYALLAPDAVKVVASTPAEVQSLLIFAEMAMQQGSSKLLIAEAEGLVSAVGAGWAAFLVRSLLQVAKRHGVTVTMTVNPERLSGAQLEVIMSSSGAPPIESVGTPDRIPVARAHAGRAG